MNGTLYELLKKLVQPMIAVMLVSSMSTSTTINSLSNKIVESATRGIDTDGSLSVLSYNVWGIPVSLQGHEQSYRFEHLPSTILASDSEIICLQEVFHKSLQTAILDANAEYFVGSDYNCTESRVLGLVRKDCYGGLMTLSKFPIVQEQFFAFQTDNSNMIEDVGHKGFLATEVLRNGKLLLLINTHLHADRSLQAEQIRLMQLAEIENYLGSLDQSAYESIYLVGDFNMINDNPGLCYRKVTDSMDYFDTGASMPEVFTSDYRSNKYANKHEPARLDYIFVKNTTAHKTSDAEPTWPLYDASIAFSGEPVLSDHFGWQVDIIECCNDEPVDPVLARNIRVEN